ncbi:MAG: NPCBM-associated, NEW3 domain of alpha-galactosidase [Methanocella sp. PtaU1.Bin125]|nr:MAG: NPCBM-associated, NEW3 domain of alpha-galactosidase [Methanocella sp. PtaU1.Bin125]
MVEGPRGGESIGRLTSVAMALGMVALYLAVSAPAASALLYGGPIIEACVYGNNEFFPGQTAPLQVLVQNSGYLNTLYGYTTPDALLQQAAQSFSAGGNYSAVSTQAESSQYAVTAGLNGLAGMAQATGASYSQSMSSSYYNYYQTGALGDLEVNTRPDVPIAATTALGLTCRLTTTDCPIEIMSSECVLVGSLPAGAVGGGPSSLGLVYGGLYQPMTYWVRIAPDAKPGHYKLPLIMTYKRLADDYYYASVFGPVMAYSNYVEEVAIAYLDVVIMERFDLVLSETVCTNMVPGTDGIIWMKVTNLGTLPVDEAVAFLMTPMLGAPQDEVNFPLYYQLLSAQAYNAEQPRYVEQNMLVPVQNSQYLGSMRPGESRTVTFKVSVSEYAEPSDIPLSAVVSYHDPWDQQKSSNIETFGVRVEPEMRFTVNPEPIEIKCGRSCVSNLTLANNGTMPARDAIVRMNALDPFTVSYDTMYLGDVAPGENVTTRFGIKVKPDAVPGEYYVTLEVKYYDSEDDPHVTKIIRKAIVVQPPPTLWEILLENWPIVLGLIALIVLGLLYFGYKRLKQNRKRPEIAPGLTGQEGNLITGGDGDTRGNR